MVGEGNVEGAPHKTKLQGNGKLINVAFPSEGAGAGRQHHVQGLDLPTQGN